MTDELPVSLRVGLAEDARFIQDSWCKSLRHYGANEYAIDWYPRKLADITEHMERSTVLVAHLEGYPDDIVSYLVFLQRRGIILVHFAYTKDSARKQGIVRRLLEMANPGKLPVAFDQPARNAEVMAHLASRYVFDPDLWVVS